jgi:predicted RNase H-like nuclease (RuvC/YqgF family)
MASNNKSNKVEKSVDQSEGFIETAIMGNNTDVQEIYESGMNTADNPSIEIPVDSDNATNSSSEQPAEFQQLADTEVRELGAEIEALKTQIKDKQKRVRELQKKPASNGQPKKCRLKIGWLPILIPHY